LRGLAISDCCGLVEREIPKVVAQASESGPCQVPDHLFCLRLLFRVIRDRVEPAAAPAMSAMPRIVLKKPFLSDERKFLEPLMRFTSGDVRDHIVSSKSTRDLRSGVEKQRSGGEVQRSTFARFSGSLDFRLCNNICQEPTLRPDPLSSSPGDGLPSKAKCELGSTLQARAAKNRFVVFLMSSCSKRVKPASRKSSSVRAGPMHVPNPGPPCASDCVMQWNRLNP
jgi:hypothetical protein